ncbi:MAG: hypothetical protein HRU18_27845 [Pseudoalteromonas sp.]|uniref:IS66 family insertion sequence element accessory protein TnpA n=1 Tax=Pseudoalteromonas sp. TaxID=53249 RepID=UPI001D3E7970|nr:hypothetical protein [Pseudoalteromonas sp.]NRA82024.1 hypothetical protein [Pseudoalteromonas sp.]
MDLEKRKQEMYTLIEEWHSSGQTRTHFCKKRGISRTTFCHWLRKYDLDHGHVDSDQSSSTPSFVSIEVPPSVVSQLTITYPNGVQLNCPSGIDPVQLKGLIGLLD